MIIIQIIQNHSGFHRFYGIDRCQLTLSLIILNSGKVFFRVLCHGELFWIFTSVVVHLNTTIVFLIYLFLQKINSIMFYFRSINLNQFPINLLDSICSSGLFLLMFNYPIYISLNIHIYSHVNKFINKFQFLNTIYYFLNRKKISILDIKKKSMGFTLDIMQN